MYGHTYLANKADSEFKLTLNYLFCFFLDYYLQVTREKQNKGKSSRRDGERLRTTGFQSVMAVRTFASDLCELVYTRHA